MRPAGQSVIRHLVMSSLLVTWRGCRSVSGSAVRFAGARSGRRASSGERCRSRPRIRAALTEPIFGSTKRTSRTLAVRTHSAGRARIWASSIPDARSFFSRALADRVSLASCGACRRCSRDLPRNSRIRLAGRHTGLEPARDTRSRSGSSRGGLSDRRVRPRARTRTRRASPRRALLRPRPRRAPE
jgi:hypothetical protein